MGLLFYGKNSTYTTWAVFFAHIFCIYIIIHISGGLGGWGEFFLNAKPPPSISQHKDHLRCW